MSIALITVAAARKISNLVRDARTAIAVGFVPLLGLILIVRLVQWYRFRSAYPQLMSDDSELAAGFRSALHRLWFAVLFWPCLILLLIACFTFI